jgi:tetratricopeptide (TPR) repeat protein
MQSDAADSARLRGTRLAESGDFEGALAHFREALEIAPEDWADREEVEHEVTAFEEHLANAPESAPEEEQQ